MQASYLRTTVFQLDDEDTDAMEREAVIVLSDDDDEVVVDAQPQKRNKRKRLREEEEEVAVAQVVDGDDESPPNKKPVDGGSVDDDDDDDDDDLIDAKLWGEIAKRESLGPQLGLVKGIGGGGGVGQPGVLTTMQSNAIAAAAWSRKNPRFENNSQHGSNHNVPPPSQQNSRYFLPRKEVICSSCRKPGHYANACPMDNSQHMTCYICARKGHHPSTCPNNDSAGARSCFWCGTSDHHFVNCRVFSPVISHESTTCFQCGKKGHVTCSSYSSAALASKPYCSNCGGCDHTHTDCPDPRCAELLHPSLYSGKTISLKALERCSGCGGQGHLKNQCDAYRRYVLDERVARRDSSDYRDNEPRRPRNNRRGRR